jgi:hypothetical protein
LLELYLNHADVMEDIYMNLVSFDWGCKSAGRMKANQHKNGPRRLGPRDSNIRRGKTPPTVVYTWVHTNNDDGTKIVKIGVSNYSAADYRIRQCARRWSVVPSDITKANVGKEAIFIEREALKLGASPLGLPRIDGYTEMRLVNDDQYQQILEVINA